jgi:DUF1009 family protein
MNKLGIIAGGGELPARVIEACRAEGRRFFVLALEGQADPALVAGIEHAWVRLGAAGEAIERLRAAGVEEIVMAGKVTRPGLKELRPDLKAMALMTKAGAGALGDDGLLKAVVTSLENEGFRVRGVDELIDGLLAREGLYGRHRPDAQAKSDIARGIAVVQALGAVDVGQAAVVQQGIVLGVEAAEGTDGLLARCAGLRRDGAGGVLVKLKKAQQERRVDLPTLGPDSVTAAAQAGLCGIAFEAGGCLVLDAAKFVREADEAGIFLLGMSLSE